MVEFGAAWKRSSGSGLDFLSVTLDDPALPASVNVAMFLSDHHGQATLVWQRTVKRAATAEAKPVRSRSRRTEAPSPATAAFR
jgi:Protein of unknown function (DUF736)